MVEVTRELTAALESFCADSAQPVLTAKRERDLEALRAHLALFSSIRPEVRRAVVHLLGRLKDTASVATIRSLLSTIDEEDRIAAISALGWIGTADALTAVLEARYDRSEDVRRMVIISLGRIGGSAAADALREMKDTDPTGYVRAQAAEQFEVVSKSK